MLKPTSHAAASAIKDKIASADHSDLKTSGFWISQIFMIIATITGVYLAAQAGLEQAIQFDEITGNQSNYYLRHSLHEEVSSNVKMLRTYNKEYFGRRISENELKMNTPELRQFVWTAMEQSPFTLETPSVFLNEIQNFYASVKKIMDNRINRVYGPTLASRLLTEQLDHMEKDVLPLLAKNITSLHEALTDAGVSIPVIDTQAEPVNTEKASDL